MRRLTIGLLVVWAACGGDKNESMSGSSTGGEDSGATLGMSSDPTTGGGTTVDSGVAATGFEVTGVETSNGSNGEVTSMGPTSANPSEDPSVGETEGMALCEMLCAKGVECEVDLGEECAGMCTFALQSGEEACQAATEAAYACLAGLSCREFVEVFEAEDFVHCEAEGMAQEEACVGDVCEVGVGGNEEGTECGIQKFCTDGQFEMDCDVTTCVCTTDGEPSGMCAAEGVCMDFELLADKAAACCGF